MSKNKNGKGSVVITSAFDADSINAKLAEFDKMRADFLAKAESERTANIAGIDAKMATLPEMFGKKTFAEVATMVSTYNKAGTVSPNNKSLAVGSRATGEGSRPRVSDEKKAEIKAFIQALPSERSAPGWMSGQAIADKYGISLPTLQGYKKDWNMVKATKASKVAA